MSDSGIEPVETVRTVRLAGEVDIASAPALRKEIDTLFVSGCSSLVVDLGDVVFIDSSGLGVLIGALRRAKERGGSVSVVGASDDVARLFSITGLDGLFGIGRS